MRFSKPVTVAAAAAALLVPAQGAAAKPELRVAAAKGAPASVAAGAGFTVSYGVRRSGSGFRTATLRYYLSPTKRKGRDAVRLTGKKSLARLRRKKSVKGSLVLLVPASTPAGNYHLLACAERVKGKRAKKAGRCKATATRIRVTVPLAPAPQGPPAGLPAAVPPPAPPPGPPPIVDGTADTTQPGFVPAPLDVSPALDTPRQTVQRVTPEGGTVTATGADGTVYTLVVPPQGLTDPEQITMTPLSAIGGLPFQGGQGVQLEPDGLRLSGPAKLTVDPPAPIPLAERATFSYLGSGDDLHLYPASFGDDAIEYELLHFSAYGYGKATSADRDAQNDRVPSDREAWARQNLARAMQEVELAKREGREVDMGRWSSAFEVAWFVWGNEGVRAALQAAVDNDAVFEKAAHEFASWSRHGQLFGMDRPELEAKLNALFVEGAENFRKSASERCVENKDPYQAIRMVGIERQMQLLGFPTSDFVAAMDKCYRFDLEIDLRLEFDWDEPHMPVGVDEGTLVFHLRAFDEEPAKATPTLTAATLDFPEPDESWAWERTELIREAEAQGPVVDWRQPDSRGEPREPIVEVFLDWGGIAEYGTYCGGEDCEPIPDWPASTWALGINALYADQYVGDEPPVIRRWEVQTGVGNEIFATKESRRSQHSDLVEGTGTEDVEFRLLHKPVP